MKRLLILLVALSAAAQQQPDVSKELQSHGRRTDRQFEDTQRMVDDAVWYFRLGDVANIDKFEIASSKPRREKNPNDINAGNAVIFPVYVFSPKNLKGKAPMLVFAHGGVHGRLTTNYAHIFREGLERGFVIVSPEYRGSIGHGGDLYSQIDYGGAEIDDTHDARNWAVENLPFVDGSRVGIFGWSHGGYHTLMNVFQWPDDYKVAYAGVPVSDLVARMGHTGQDYRDIFEEFIGKQPEDNVGVPAQVAGRTRGQATHPSSHPHDDERRGRPRARGRAHDRGAEGRREAVRVQDLPERARRAPLQSHRHEAREGLAEGDVGFSGPPSEVMRVSKSQVSKSQRDIGNCFATLRLETLNL
jgi:acetyl esterase/lipase